MHIGEVDIGETDAAGAGEIPGGGDLSVIEPVAAAAARIGASLVPVMVTSTCLVTVPPWPSLSVTVKLSTLV